MDTRYIHDSTGQKIKAPAERLMCAAMWIRDGQTHPHQPRNIETGFVVCGFRHHNILQTNWILRGEEAEIYSDIEFGFLTTYERFLNREEAMKLARTYLDHLPEGRTALYSEDVW